MITRGQGALVKAQQTNLKSFHISTKHERFIPLQSGPSPPQHK